MLRLGILQRIKQAAYPAGDKMIEQLAQLGNLPAECLEQDQLQVYGLSRGRPTLWFWDNMG
ncbi:hypothetical protein D3C76_1811570 [compost metagenome]